MEEKTITVKLDIDVSEAMEKLEEIKKQLQEILELQNKLEA